MSKKRTKKVFIEEMIAKKLEDIWLFEIVRDRNRSLPPDSVVVSGKSAALEADAAEHRIEEIKKEIEWLEKHLESLSV